MEYFYTVFTDTPKIPLRLFFFSSNTIILQPLKNIFGRDRISVTTLNNPATKQRGFINLQLSPIQWPGGCVLTWRNFHITDDFFFNLFFISKVITAFFFFSPINHLWLLWDCEIFSCSMIPNIYFFYVETAFAFWKRHQGVLSCWVDGWTGKSSFKGSLLI